jgi:hypothetical protein
LLIKKNSSAIIKAGEIPSKDGDVMVEAGGVEPPVHVVRDLRSIITIT